MRDNLRRVCELQRRYSPDNTPEMQERGLLIRRALVADVMALRSDLSAALGPFGADFLVEASDGIGRKTELPWVRFCSQQMSPRPTEGFYVVLHFSTDGSGVNVVVGCSSSKFRNGYTVVLPSEDIDKRCSWARQVVLESREQLEPFTDANDFGARSRLPRSFERASALVKKIDYSNIEDDLVRSCMIDAAGMLRMIYAAQQQGRELSPADQVELDIIQIVQPRSSVSRRQGFGLKPVERRAVELRAMDISRTWLISEGFSVKDTSAYKPYDLEAEKSGNLLLVEVKGTTSDFADSIAMTHGEVDLHRKHKGETALFIVSGIRLDRSTSEPTATGGKLEALIGWDIDSWQAEPTAFRVTRR